MMFSVWGTEAFMIKTGISIFMPAAMGRLGEDPKGRRYLRQGKGSHVSSGGI